MEKLTEALALLASKLGQSMESLWPHAVRFVVLDAVFGLVASVVVPGAIIFVGLKWWKKTKEEDSDYSGSDGELLRALIGLALVISTIIGAICAINSIPTILDPEGALVLRIMKSGEGK